MRPSPCPSPEAGDDNTCDTRALDRAPLSRIQTQRVVAENYDLSHLNRCPVKFGSRPNGSCGVVVARDSCHTFHHPPVWIPNVGAGLRSVRPAQKHDHVHSSVRGTAKDKDSISGNQGGGHAPALNLNDYEGATDRQYCRASTDAHGHIPKQTLSTGRDDHAPIVVRGGTCVMRPHVS